jgi:hypothetical protein
MRESVAREFIAMSTVYAKDTAHVRKQFAKRSARRTQHLTTLAQKATTEAARAIQAGVAKTFNKSI